MAKEIRRLAFVVEDQLETQHALVGLLEVEGYKVLGAAATEFEATAWLMDYEGSCDVAIIDLLLPEGSSGFAVLRRFAAAANARYLAVFSGYITDVIREKCFQLGADAVIEKHEVDKLARYLRMIADGGPGAEA